MKTVSDYKVGMKCKNYEMQFQAVTYSNVFPFLHRYCLPQALGSSGCNRPYQLQTTQTVVGYAIVSLLHMSGSAWNFSDDKFAAALDAAEVADTADGRYLSQTSPKLTS